MKVIELFEAKQVGVVYHYCSDHELIDIIKRDKMSRGDFWIPLVTGHTKGGKPIITQTYGVSLTRLLNKRMQRWYGNSIIALNGDKLSERYKIVQHEDAFLKNPRYNKHHDNQGEEFVMAPSGIPNISNYIIRLYMPGNMLDMYMRPGGVFNERELLSNFEIKRLPDIRL
jgi:hypothetical protein